jgi:hypothetical protein
MISPLAAYFAKLFKHGSDCTGRDTRTLCAGTCGPTADPTGGPAISKAGALHCLIPVECK